VNIASSIGGLVFVAFYFGRGPFVPSLADTSSILRLAGPVAAISVGLQALSYIDLWMLNVIGTDVAAVVKGDYVAATNVARIPNVLAFALTATLVPVVARAFAENAPERAAATINGSLRFMAMMLLPACAIVAVNGTEILALLFSSAYADGGALLAVLIFAQGFGYTIYMTLASVLIATGQAGASARLALGLVVVAALMSAVLVAAAGAEGAAWSSLFTTVVAAFGALALLRARLRLRLTLDEGLRIVIVAGLVAVLGWWLPADGLMLLGELALLGVTMLAALWWLGLITRTDVDTFVPYRLRRYFA